MKDRKNSKIMLSMCLLTRDDVSQNQKNEEKQSDNHSYYYFVLCPSDRIHNIHTLM